MVMNITERDITLKEIIDNLQTMSAGWALMNDLTGIEADMIRILQRLVKDVCERLAIFLMHDQSDKKTALTSIQMSLSRIGELQSVANLCLNYVFVTQNTCDLHYQLNFLSRHADDAIHLLESNMLR